MPKIKLMQHDYGNLENMLDVAEDTKEWFDKQIQSFAIATKGQVYHGGASTKREKFAHEVKDSSGKRVNISRSKQLSRMKGNKNLKPGKGGNLRSGLADEVSPSARAYQKAHEKGNYRYIKDVIRASVVYPVESLFNDVKKRNQQQSCCAGVIRALDLLRRDGASKNCLFFRPVEIKNNTQSLKAAGYADINIIVVCPENQHLCELQLHFQKMLEKKKDGGHKAYDVERKALKGKSIGDVNKEQPHMAPATSFGGGFVQNKRVAMAKRARMDGRAVYGPAIRGLLSDPKYNRMQQKIRSLKPIALKNAKDFIASVKARDEKIEAGLIDAEFDFDY